MTNETNQLEYATKRKTKNICSKQTSHIKCKEKHTVTLTNQNVHTKIPRKINCLIRKLKGNAKLKDKKGAK